MESTGKCTRHEFEGGSGSTALFILSLGTRWRLVARLRSQPLNSRGKGPPPPARIELGGPQNRSERAAEEKNGLPLPGSEPRTVQPAT